MIVESPEVLNGAESDYFSLVCLPRLCLVVLVEPQRPGVLKLLHLLYFIA